MPDLDHIERWMQCLMMDVEGVRSALRSEAAGTILPCSEENIESLVLPSKQLSSIQRLTIYGNMYFSRLIEILAEEFPTVQHLFGPELFELVVKGYVTRHPSTHYSLAGLGSQFPAFLADEAEEIPHRAFAASVATVERAMEDVFDAARAEPISFEDLTAIPLPDWGGVRMRTIPALRLMQLAYPVNPYMTEVREDRHIAIPAAARAYVAVYRHHYRVWRVDLDEQQFTLLTALQQEESLGSALARCAECGDANPEALLNAVGDWFREWMAEGLFCEASAST